MITMTKSLVDSYGKIDASAEKNSKVSLVASVMVVNNYFCS